MAKSEAEIKVDVVVPVTTFEEHAAWDLYAAMAQYSDPVLAARHADKLLEERRKRFGKAMRDA